MNKRGPLLDALRAQYEAVRESADGRGNAESFEAIDARMRKVFRWLEQAITYLWPEAADRSPRRPGLRHGLLTARSASTSAVDETILEDLVRLMLGRDSAFLTRAPLAGLHR